MAVARSMGPERVCPEEPGPPEAPDGAAGWSGDEEEEEEEEEEEGEEEGGGGGGYLYQPLRQEPEQGPGEAGPSSAPAGFAETGPGLQERLQVPPSARRAGEAQRHGPAGGGRAPAPAARLSPQMLRLHLPDPPADSEEEEEEEEGAEGAAAQSSRSSIPMDAEHVELVKRTMASVKLPTLGIPAWASQISEEQWKDVVQRTLQARQSLGVPRPEWQ
ncbi:male-enhanced antigen 1 isoform X1 [Apus apus]|uniref:male-enhanced antigen 1 isoform X1 n=1 Tax=Apus apus TaxID=8895 RepID=UPI0021F8B02D|nr:male-enhanced antigen 1 isoform X1 [Apus apus]